MIKITFRNGAVVKWKRENYSDYKYDGKFFIIIKGEEWIGFYNMSDVVSIIVEK